MGIRRSLALWVAIALVLTACTGDGGRSTDTTTDDPADVAPTSVAASPTTAPTSTTIQAETSTTRSFSLGDRLALYSIALDLPFVAEGECEPTQVGDALPGVVAQTYGDGPIFATLGTWDGTIEMDDNTEYQGWYYAKVLWSVLPEYSGPVLIRGRQLDGQHVLLFGPDEPVPSGRHLTDLAFPPGTAQENQAARFFPSAVLVASPGCYGLQIDSLVNGEPHRDVIVFKAIQIGQ